MRSLLIARRRHGGFGQKLHGRKADSQSVANAAIEISFQDRSSLRGGPAERCHTYREVLIHVRLRNLAGDTPRNSDEGYRRA